MKIGELSKATGVSIPTIRVYEREGLIEPADRTDGMFRVFSETQRHRLDFIKRLRNLGFGLDEVKLLLSLAGAGSTEDKSLIARAISAALSKRKSDLAKLESRLEAAIVGGLPFEEIECAFRDGGPTQNQ